MPKSTLGTVGPRKEVARDTIHWTSGLEGERPAVEEVRVCEGETWPFGRYMREGERSAELVLGNSRSAYWL